MPIRLLPPPLQGGLPTEQPEWLEPSTVADVAGSAINLPRISLVTPSYNQADYLETTIRSVLQQNYPNLEFIIIDGGSTDHSLDIIHYYASHLTAWVSEPDGGQSHAINKGMAKATGEILGWINSDDFLLPGALHHVAQALQGAIRKEAIAPAWGVGRTLMVEPSGQPTYCRMPLDITYEGVLNWLFHWFPQQSTFWTRSLWEQAGPLDESLHYVMDFELWLKMLKVVTPKLLPVTLASYRHHPAAKCVSHLERVEQEILQVLQREIATTQATDTLRSLSTALAQTYDHYVSQQRQEIDQLKAQLAAVQIENQRLQANLANNRDKLQQTRARLQHRKSEVDQLQGQVQAMEAERRRSIWGRVRRVLGE
jgi:regulator of replication initiation timing